MNKVVMAKILICSIFIIILLINSSYAFGDIFADGKGFLEVGNSIENTISITALTEASDDIYNFLLGIGIIVAVIIAMILGIQFMWASAEEKAKIKESLMPFIAGCVVVFGTFTIWKVVVNVGNDVEEKIEGTKFDDGKLDASDIYEGIVAVEDLTNDELKKLYNEQYIAQTLNTNTGKDPRYNGEIMSLEDAVKALPEYLQQIYNEAKRRGLLADDGISWKNSY